MLACINTCQNATLFEVTCQGSYFLTESNSKDGEPSHESQNKPDKQETMSEDRADEYYNIMSVDKKSSTAIMLENLADFLLAGKSATQRLEEQFKVSNCKRMSYSYGLIQCNRMVRCIV